MSDGHCDELEIAGRVVVDERMFFSLDRGAVRVLDTDEDLLADDRQIVSDRYPPGSPMWGRCALWSWMKPFRVELSMGFRATNSYQTSFKISQSTPDLQLWEFGMSMYLAQPQLIPAEDHQGIKPARIAIYRSTGNPVLSQVYVG